MKRIRRQQALIYRLDARLAPALRVEAGEAFVIETEDASSGHLTAGDRPPTPDKTPYVRYTAFVVGASLPKTYPEESA